jgi:hypothetical protein
MQNMRWTRSMKIEEGRVESRWGGGWESLFGVPILVAAYFVVAYFVQIGGFFIILALFFGIMLVALGGKILLGRAGWEIDANSRTYRRWSGLLPLTKETTGSLDEFDKVAVDREVRTWRSRGRRVTCTVYPIRLVGRMKRLDIEEFRYRAEARGEATQMAKALGLPLADRTGSEEIVCEAAHLDESLRQRRRRTGEGPGDIPEKFRGMKTELRREGDQMVLEIPPEGLISNALGCFLVALLCSAAWCLLFYFDYVCVLALLPLGLGVGVLVRAIRRRYTVRVSPDRLHVTTRGVFFCRTTEIPADELVELRITTAEDDQDAWCETQIVARSGRTAAKFGAHLSPEEKQWIKTVLEHVLTT